MSEAFERALERASERDEQCADGPDPLDAGPELVELMAKEQRFEDRYKSLRRVFDDALRDATMGKGAARHGSSAPFEEQPMLQVRRALGPGFTRGQAMKKILESRGLAPQQAASELREAMVYLAGEILMLEAEERDA